MAHVDERSLLGLPRGKGSFCSHTTCTMHFIYLGYDDERECHLIVNLEQITVVRLDDHDGALTLHIADVSGHSYVLRGREASKAFGQVMQHTQNMPHGQPHNVAG